MNLEREGYLLVECLFDTDIIEALRIAFANADVARSKRDGQTFGARNILAIPEVRKVAQCAKLRALLGQDIQAIRGIFFDKTDGANWPVAWHQDLTLALRERNDIEGWTNWTIKRGITHVQAPVDILNRMVTMRLHLDDCDHNNGPLRVIAGSQNAGILSRLEVEKRARTDAHTITAKVGDALFMKPLILHASSPAKVPSHRRVLHLEFAPVDLLPETLAWAATA